MSGTRIDHAILMTRDLDDCAGRLLAEHDLGSVAGGEHRAWGTANRIVPAGSSYLEIMGIGDHQRAMTTDLGRYALSRSADGDTLTLVCLAVDDIGAVCARLGLERHDGSRVTPDGTTLVWWMAGLEAAIADGMPFFIQWDRTTGADVADPDIGRRATGISRVALGGDAARIREYVGADVPGLDLVGGPPEVHAVTLGAPGGDVVLRNPARDAGVR